MRHYVSLILIFTSLFAQAISAQDKEDEKKVFPEVEDVTLTTKDGVLLNCSWYPGQKEKESIPVLLLHGWNENRHVYKDFAALLQEKHGYAVLVPDIRGHGASKKTEAGVDLDRERFGRKEILTVFEDIEQCRRFLQEKNNKGELNLELLTAIASEESTLFAVDWAIRDWSWADFNGQKQGKFVKALVLLSPTKNFQGLVLNRFAKAPIISGRGAPKISMLVAAGVGEGQEKIVRDVRSFHTTVKRLRPPIRAEGKTAKEKERDLLEKKALYYKDVPSTEQGVALLKNQQFVSFVTTFINIRLLHSGKDYKWHEIRK